MPYHGEILQKVSRRCLWDNLDKGAYCKQTKHKMPFALRSITSYYSMRKSRVVKFFLNSCTTAGVVGGPGGTRVGTPSDGRGSVWRTGVPGIRVGSFREEWKDDQGATRSPAGEPGSLGGEEVFSAIATQLRSMTYDPASLKGVGFRGVALAVCMQPCLFDCLLTSSGKQALARHWLTLALC